MPVVYKCPECGGVHPAPVEFDSQEEFQAVPWNQVMGSWYCEHRLRAGRRVYIQAHLFWVGEYELVDWDDLQRLLVEARDAVRRRRPGAWEHLEEVEHEVVARRFRVVAHYPWKRVVWAAYRTRAECVEYLKWLGVKPGLGHRHGRVRFEVTVEEAGCEDSVATLPVPLG